MVIGRHDVEHTSIETLDIPEPSCQVYVFVCQVDIGNECSLLHDVGLHVVHGANRVIVQISQGGDALGRSALAVT